MYVYFRTVSKIKLYLITKSKKQPEQNQNEKGNQNENGIMQRE